MRAVALCVLVLVASASAAWNTITSSESPFYVSQTGLIPGQTTISATALTAGQVDVRTGSAWTSSLAGPQTDSFVAPYAGCYYLYRSDKTFISTACTSWAEWANSASPRTPAAVTMEFKSNNGPSVSTTAYTFTLNFRVDAGYAGTAFEFLNLNVANPTDSNTRCGVSYNNLLTASPLQSPHSNGGQSFTIENPGNTDDNGLWSFADLLTDVSTTGSLGNVTYLVKDFNKALRNCGWLRDETTKDFIIYRAQIRITTVQQGRSIRGVLYKSIKETVIAIGIQFNTQVSATSGTINVNNELILFAQVKKQVFDPVSRTAYLLLFTSSQGPYQLEPITATEAEAAASVQCSDTTGGCSSWTTPITKFHFLSTADVDPLKLPSAVTEDDGKRVGGSGSRAECWNQTNGIPNYALESPQAFSQCNQYWFLQLGAPNNCGELFTGQQTLNGNWNATFNIKCHSSYTGSCVIQAPIKNTISVLFGTQSDNYCPRIVDTITATADLKVYDDVARTHQQSQFVFGTTSYFVATVRSTVQMAALFTEEVAITRGGQLVNNALAATPASATWVKPDTTTGTDRQVVFAAGYNSAVGNNSAAYFKATEATDCQSGGSGFNKVASSSPATQTGNLITSTDYITNRCYFTANTFPILDYAITQYNATSSNTGLLTAMNYFQWYWNSAVSNATGDFAEITEVKWIGRLRYTDQAAAPKVSSIIRANHLDAVGSTTASVTSTMSAPQAAAPSEAAISTTTIAVAAAAVAAVAVMAIAAFVVLRSRNVKAEAETNLESVTLGSVQSASSAHL